MTQTLITDDNPIRMKILAESRSIQIRNSENPNLRLEVTIGRMASDSGYEAGVIKRVCTEMEEEDLIRWTSPATTGLIQETRRFEITAPGRQYLEQVIKHLDQAS